MGQGGSQPAALQVPAAALPNLDSQPYLMVSFGNAAYFELAHNWAKSVQAIGAPFLIAGEVDLRCARCCCSPLVPHCAEMVSIRYGVLANAAAQIPGCLHAFLGAKPVSLPHG
jgi:hypothetical protein